MTAAKARWMSDGDESLERLIRDIHAGVIQVQGDVKALRETQDRHGTFIDGNGRDAAATRLKLIEEWIERADKALEKPDTAGVQIVKWEAIGKWGAPAAAIVALLVSIANAMGWIG